MFGSLDFVIGCSMSMITSHCGVNLLYLEFHAHFFHPCQISFSVLHASNLPIILRNIGTFFGSRINKIGGTRIIILRVSKTCVSTFRNKGRFLRCVTLQSDCVRLYILETGVAVSNGINARK